MLSNSFPQCDVGTVGLELLGKLGLTGFFIVLLLVRVSLAVGPLQGLCGENAGMGEGRRGFQNLLEKGRKERKNTGVILFSISTFARTGGRETLKNIFINRFSHSW